MCCILFRFTDKISLFMRLLSLSCYLRCPSRSAWFIIIMFVEEYKLWSSFCPATCCVPLYLNLYNNIPVHQPCQCGVGVRRFGDSVSTVDMMSVVFSEYVHIQQLTRQSRWWRQRLSPKRRTPTPHWYSWSSENTSLHNVAVKASNCVRLQSVFFPQCKSFTALENDKYVYNVALVLNKLSTPWRPVGKWRYSSTILDLSLDEGEWSA
jgi:hypothetical protein